jgi:hypothetical protein
MGEGARCRCGTAEHFLSLRHNLTQRTLVLARILIAKPVSTFAEYGLALPLVEDGCAVAACGLLGAASGHA